MGADLYIKNLPRDPQHTGFRTDLGVGYFRDAYNLSDVLWEFGLSWWTLHTEHPTWFSKDYEMSVTGAKGFLQLLEDSEATFQKNIKTFAVWKNSGSKYDREALDKLTEKDKEKEREWYISHAKELKDFLKKAIELKSKIIFSV